MKNFTRSLLALVFTVFISLIQAQTPTVGLVQQDTGTTENGYILFAPLSDSVTYLMDKCGRKVHTWKTSYAPGASVYLLPDGNLLRPGRYFNAVFASSPGGMGGMIQKIDWDGNVVWSYLISDSVHQQHHDVKGLPNGNVLVISWERKTIAQATAAGRNPIHNNKSVWSETVFELQPVGTNQANIVWEWHVWDHLVQDFDNTKANFGVVKESPEKIDLNYTPKDTTEDWMHFNSIDYNPYFDQVVVNSPNFNEFYVIDHSTTTAEAATGTGGKSGKGGDILYRWGNPLAYGRGTVNDQKLFFEHNVHWIEPGLPYENHIMVYNNGLGRPDSAYSTVDIIRPPVTRSGVYNPSLPYGPASYIWSYNQGNPNNLYSGFISGAQQLANGNVLVCVGGSGLFLETNTTQKTVWKYISPVIAGGIVKQGDYAFGNVVFRATFIPQTYNGLRGRNLLPGTIIENQNTFSEVCSMPSISIADAEITEGNSGVTQMRFSVTLNQPSANVIRVSYKTRNLTALAGSDYAETSGKLTFRPGDTVKYINVPVYGDVIPELTEFFAVRLGNAINGALADSVAGGKISNDDAAFTIGAMENNEANTKANSKITVYPNPVTDVLNISVPAGNSKYTITVLDITGRLLKQVVTSVNQNKFTVNTTGLSKGTYIIHMVSNTESISTTFIKN